MRLPWINIPEEVEAGAAAAILHPQGEVLGLRRKPKPTQPEAEQMGEEKTGPGRDESTVLKAESTVLILFWLLETILF